MDNRLDSDIRRSVSKASGRQSRGNMYKQRWTETWTEAENKKQQHDSDEKRGIVRVER